MNQTLKNNMRSLIAWPFNKLSNYRRQRLTQLHYPEFTQLSTTPKTDKEHLQAAMDWLCLAQDKKECGGVSAYFDVSTKEWGPAYHETTGYIIETFLKYFSLTGKKEYLNRAVEMGNWEIDEQYGDGAFGEIKKDGTVGKKIFNTGQILIGLILLFKTTKENKYLIASKRAASWIINNQDSDGSWHNFSTKGPRTYDARVSWPLLEFNELTKETKYFESAKRNLDWILKQQQSNYWFDNTSLTKNNRPWTHLIAYTISGLIECYILLGKTDKDIFSAFYGSAAALLEYYKTNKSKYLPCSFDKNWKSKDRYSCLTGDCQLAIVWMQIYQLTKEEEFLNAATRMIEQVKSTQILDTEKKEVLGGIAGSYPLTGDYATFKILNWATKFFADALILKKEISNKKTL